MRERLQKQFRFIQVDEYQDTNRAQNEIVELLAGEEDNVLAVGDGDQSIYEWRGASPDAIPRFIENGKTKTRAVPDREARAELPLDAADHRGGRQADPPLRATGSPSSSARSTKAGEPVKCAKLATPEDEAEAVAIEHREHDEVAATQPREIAVFYRTNDMSPADRAVAGQAADPVPGRRQRELLRPDGSEGRPVDAAVPCNPKDGICFARIANKPARGMGDALIGRLEAFAEQHDIDLLTAMATSAWTIIRDEHDKPLSDAALRALPRRRGEVFGVHRTHRRSADVANEVLDHTRYDDWLKERVRGEGRVRVAAAERERAGQQHRGVLPRRTRGRRSADYLQIDLALHRRRRRSRTRTPSG